LSDALRPELLRILALLEAHHGVGVRGDEPPLWLEERLRQGVLALMQARSLSIAELLGTLAAEPDAALELANALRVGETRFYRDAAQWEALRRSVIPGLLRARADAQPLLALSAGCSTGEEAWSLAMLLAEGTTRGAGPGARARVLGIDRSPPALATARAARYDAGSEQRLPRELAQRFLRPALDGSVTVTSELQASVSFQCRDLMRGAPAGRYAIIVCKNVLIYFGDEAQERLVSELLRSLSDDGVLLVARSEVPIVRAFGGHADEIAPGITAFLGGS
jgi:chemotaxis methyl-accepting protein methylase